MKTSWPTEHLRLIREHYAEPEGPAYLAEATGMTYQQICQLAWRMGLSRSKKLGYKIKGIKKFFRQPQPLVEELKTGKCPGKFAGPCGKRLWRERAFTQEGFSTELFDLVCEAGHRFPIPGKEEKDENYSCHM